MMGPEEKKAAQRRAGAKYDASPSGKLARSMRSGSIKGAARRLRYDETPRGRQHRMLGAAKKRAQEKGLPFNLTVNDFFIPDFCPVLGLRLSLKLKRGRGPDSPSLDRIIPELGYVRDNVRVISWRANELRKNGTTEELRLIGLDAVRLDKQGGPDVG